MRPRHLLLAAAFAAGAGAGALLVLRPPVVEAEGDDPFHSLRERFRTFETAYFELPRGLTDLGTIQPPATIHASSRGRLAYDDGRDTRWIWTGDAVHRVSYTRTPVHVEVLRASPRIAEVWAELRTGFANSTIHHVDPSELGYALAPYAEEDAVLIDLPFDWARDYALFVIHTPRADRLERVVVADRSTQEVVWWSLGPLDFSFAAEAQFWEVPLQLGVFEPCGVPRRQSHATWTRGTRFDPTVLPVDPKRHLPHEVCEAREGHQHGPRVHEEHADDELHGGAVGDLSGCFPDDHSHHEPRGHGDEHGQDDPPRGADRGR